MSLTVYVPSTRGITITHNLIKMARCCGLTGGVTLADVLWYQKESGFVKAKDIISLLDEAIKLLINRKEGFLVHEPANGWGSYEQLLNFVIEYHQGLKDHPDFELDVSS